MKQLLLTAAATLLTLAAFAQGVVYFGNASTVPGWNPVADRSVRFSGWATLYNPLLVPGAPVSSNYAGVDLSSLRAALYYAPGVRSDFLSFSPAVGGWATFKSSTSATAGSWFGGTRTLNGVAAQGGLASLFVVVWDTRVSTDPLSYAAMYSFLWSRSEIFQYTTPTSPTPAPAEFLPNDLRGFLWPMMPEPSTFALTSLGIVTLLLLRRHRRS